MKKLKEILKTMKDNSDRKTYIFFGFYFVLFLVIAVMLRTGSSYDSSSIEKLNSDDSGDISIDELLNNNYSFTYNVFLDDNQYQYDGDRYEEKEKFTFNGNSYYFDGNKYYMNNNNSWVEVENPYVFPELLNTEKAFTILDLSTYESYTTYDSGKLNYNFLISSNTINKEIYKVNSDFSEEPNSVVLSVDENKLIDKIVFNLDSFCVLNGLCNKSLVVELIYDNEGEVKEIGPIN